MKNTILITISFIAIVLLFGFTLLPNEQSTKGVHLTITGTDYYDLYGGDLRCGFTFIGQEGSYTVWDITPNLNSFGVYCFEVPWQDGDTWESAQIQSCVDAGIFGYKGMSAIDNNPSGSTVEISSYYRNGCK